MIFGFQFYSQNWKALTQFSNLVFSFKEKDMQFGLQRTALPIHVTFSRLHIGIKITLRSTARLLAGKRQQGNYLVFHCFSEAKKNLIGKMHVWCDVEAKGDKNFPEKVIQFIVENRLRSRVSGAKVALLFRMRKL